MTSHVGIGRRQGERGGGPSRSTTQIDTGMAPVIEPRIMVGSDAIPRRYGSHGTAPRPAPPAAARHLRVASGRGRDVGARRAVVSVVGSIDAAFSRSAEGAA
jgi:hypothetical protein